VGEQRWRCVNDILGYCNGEPEVTRVPATCGKNPGECGNYQTWSEISLWYEGQSEKLGKKGRSS